MPDETPKDASETALTREHLETSKERAIVFREWAYFALAVIVAVSVAYWSFWSQRQANNATGFAQAKLAEFAEKGDKVLDNVNATTENLKTASAKAPDLIEAATGALNEIKPTLAQARQTMGAAQSGITTDTTALANLTDGLTRETSGPKGILPNLNDKLTGDKGLIPTFTLAAGNLNDSIGLFNQAAKGLPSLITDTDNLIKDGDKLAVSLDGTVTKVNTNVLGERIIAKDGTVTGTGLTGIIENGNAISFDSRLKWHQILFPPPVKGFWPNVKRGITYILTPVAEGTRIYFQVKSLPVRITQPIPTK